jgi:hypothetical protein
VAGTDAVRAARVVRGLIDEVNKSELGRSEESLEFRRIYDITFQRIKRNLSPDVVLEFMNIGKDALPLRLVHELISLLEGQ